MQHSLFEPLYSLQTGTMEKCQAALFCFTIPPPSPSASFHAIHTEISPPSFDQDISISSSFQQAHILSLSSFPYHTKAIGAQDLSSDFTHVKFPLSHSGLPASSPSSPSSIHCASSPSKLPLSNPITVSSTTSPTTPHSNSDNIARHDRHCDDGSIASKLFSSITKSISSPSLQLASCKEVVRETPYQKTLKLKHMKLQHCAEALGMESSDNSSFLYHDSQCMHMEKIGMEGNAYTFPPSFTLSNSRQESSLKSVKSSPNLTTSASPLITNHSRYTRSRSFPPPLSHTLPTSSSCHSFSLTLRAYREDGRFILKETMVPSKHYFHANRSNGRLTLRVVTREEEEEGEEHFAGQEYNYEELSYRKSQRESLSEADEELVCVQKSTSIHTSNDMGLQRLNCIAIDNSNNKYSEDDDKRNVISNVITLSLQASTHSVVTLHKAQILCHPLVSSSLKQSAFIDSTEMTHGFISSNHAISTFPQSKQNFIWETNLMPCAVATSGSRRIQCKGGGGGDVGGCGGGGAVVAPAFVMEEMRVKSVMKAVTHELATSVIAEGGYDNGDWCLAGEKKALLGGVESGESSTILGGYASAIDGAIIGNDGQIGDVAKFSDNTSYFCEEEKASNANHEGGKERSITTSPLNLALQVSSCNATLQSEEWLHTLHCKELFDRHHLGHGLIKLHCIPTRS